MADIDPVEFGMMRADIANLKTEISSLRENVSDLLELANKSRGGFWAGMSIASMVGGIVTWIVTTFFHFPKV